MEKWVNDDKKWSDVFVAKPYEYLSIIIDGDIPYFDKIQNKWVVKQNEDYSTKVEDDEDEKSIEAIKAAKEEVLSETVQQTLEYDDDIPF